MMAWISELYSGLGPGMQAVLTASWQASVLAVMVLGVQAAFGRWLSPRWRYALWSVVVVRLLLPVTPGSALSVFNLFASHPQPVVIAEPLPTMPTISTPIPVVEGLASGVESESFSGGVVATAAVWGVGDVVMAVWLSGVLLVIAVIGMINLALALRLRHGPMIDNSELDGLVESCKREMGVRRAVYVYEDSRMVSPALAGMFRPTLLLPEGLLESLPRNELRFILLHELAHVKRHDIAMNWLLIVLSALHWFNPLVWFSFSRLRADRELARDAMVLRATGTDASQAYGQTIIHALERLARPRLSNPALAGVGDGMGQLKRRMHMIALAPRRRPALRLVGMALLVALGLIGLTDAAEPEAVLDTSDTSHEQLSTRPESDGLIENFKEAAAPGIETRVYDVRHLLVSIDSKPQSPAHHADGTAPGVPVEPGYTRDELVGQLLNLIREKVGSPDEWSANGGRTSEVSESNGGLIVKTSRGNHEALISLLAELNETRSLFVSTESMFMLLTDPAIESTGITTLLTDTEGGARIVFLDDVQTRQLSLVVKQDADSTVLAAPRVLQRNGGYASIEVSTETAYISDYLRPGNDGPPEPVIKRVREGVFLDVMATVSADRRYVTATLKPRVTNLEHPIKKRVWADRPGGKDLYIEEPVVTRAEIDLTVSMPDRATLLIDLGQVRGPMTEAEDKTDEGATRRVYALIKPTIVLASEGHADLLEAGGSGRIGVVEQAISPEVRDAKAKQPAPVATSPDPGGADDGDWRARFERVYRLDEGEVVRWVAPPFIPERGVYYRTNLPWQAEVIDYPPKTMSFRWPEMERPWSCTFGRAARVEDLLGEVLGWQTYEYSGPWVLLRTEVPGDWLYDVSAEPEARRHALFDVIRDSFGQQLSAELKPIEQHIIVAKGEWKFSPLAGSYNPQQIHIYVGDELDPDEGSGGSSGDIGDFFTKVGSRIGVRFDDQMAVRPVDQFSWGWHRSSKLREVHDPEERATRLRSLLDNLQRQTGLTFEIERRVEDVWVIADH